MGRDKNRKVHNRLAVLLFAGLFLCMTACSLPGSGKKEARKSMDWETEGFTTKAVKVGEDIAQFPYHEYDYYDLGGKFKGKASVLVGDTRFVLQRDRSTSGVCHRLLIQTKEERQWKELPVEDDGMFLAADGWQKEELYGLFNKNSENSQEYVAFLKTCGPEPRGQSAIEDMVFEEAREYFEDRRSLEETVRIIQNRVDLYLKEQN